MPAGPWSLAQASQIRRIRRARGVVASWCFHQQRGRGPRLGSLGGEDAPSSSGAASLPRADVHPCCWSRTSTTAVNCEPRSVILQLGTPKRHTIPWMNLIAAWVMRALTGSTSTHLENLSMATNKYSYPPTDRGNFPIASSPRLRRAKRSGWFAVLELADGCS
jgi:hypothetical protein